MAYSRVLRRRTRSPYLDIIQAQGPAARSAKYLEEERELAGEGLEIQREDLGLRREGLEQQATEARDTLALGREGMELGASQAKKAQDIQMAQTGLMGAYAGHKVGKSLGLWGEPAATTTPVPVAPTGPSMDVTTSLGTTRMGPGTTGTSPVTPTVAPTGAAALPGTQTTTVLPGGAGGFETVGAPTPGALPVKTAGRTVMMEPGVTAPGTAALATPGGAAPSGTGLSYGEFGGSTTGAGAGEGGMTLGEGVGYGVAGAQQAYSLYGDMDRPSSSYEKGSKSKYGRGIGRTAGSVIGGYFGGPLGVTVGGELGARFGEKTWPGIVTGMEAGDEIVEDLARLKIHSAGERTGDAIAGMNMGDPVTETLSRGVGDVIEEPSRVLDDIIPGCIIYTYFYGPHSREKRYARIFCARHMTKKRYLGYIAAGTKVIDLAKNLFRNDVEKHLWLKNKLKNAMPEPYFRYMMYKLKGGKLSIRDRIAAAFLNKWFDWEAERLGENIVINDNLRSCYHNAGSRGGA